MKIKGIITCSKCGECVDTLYFYEQAETGICPNCYDNEMSCTVAVLSIIVAVFIIISVC